VIERDVDSQRRCCLLACRRTIWFSSNTFFFSPNSPRVCLRWRDGLRALLIGKVLTAPSWAKFSGDRGEEERRREREPVGGPRRTSGKRKSLAEEEQRLVLSVETREQTIAQAREMGAWGEIPSESQG